MVYRSIVSRVVSMSSKESTVDIPACVFCGVINENDPTKIKYQDDDVVAFPDIRPAAEHHFLVIPRRHLLSPKHLDTSHRALVEHMIEVAKELLKEHDPDLTNSRFGFHWPPFNSISHLHLHAISPVSSLGFMSRLIFKPQSYWFVTLFTTYGSGDMTIFDLSTCCLASDLLFLLRRTLSWGRPVVDSLRFSTLQSANLFCPEFKPPSI